MCVKSVPLILILAVVAWPALGDVCPDPLALVSSDTSGCTRVCRGADYECCALVCGDDRAFADLGWERAETFPATRGLFDGRAGHGFEMPEFPTLTFEQRRQIFAATLSTLHAFGLAGSLAENEVDQLAELLAKATGDGAEGEGAEEG